MSFEDWMKRPVFVAQVKTASVAKQSGIAPHLIRPLPGFRSAQCLELRARVATSARKIRNSKAVWPEPTGGYASVLEVDA
jgi:hypothetical protein